MWPSAGLETYHFPPHREPPFGRSFGKKVVGTVSASNTKYEAFLHVALYKNPPSDVSNIRGCFTSFLLPNLCLQVFPDTGAFMCSFMWLCSCQSHFLPSTGNQKFCFPSSEWREDVSCVSSCIALSYRNHHLWFAFLLSRDVVEFCVSLFQLYVSVCVQREEREMI